MEEEGNTTISCIDSSIMDVNCVRLLTKKMEVKGDSILFLLEMKKKFRMQRHLQNAILCASFRYVISARLVLLEDASLWYSNANSRRAEVEGLRPRPASTLAIEMDRGTSCTPLSPPRDHHHVADLPWICHQSAKGALLFREEVNAAHLSLSWRGGVRTSPNQHSR
jgi:hypothetical protein